MFVWDDGKREANLVKHRVDFADAGLVYDNPSLSTRHGEKRYADIAVIEATGTWLTLVYVERSGNIRVISFRNASRRERRRYAEVREPN